MSAPTYTTADADTLTNHDEWRAGLRFEGKMLNIRSVRRAACFDEVLPVALAHNLREGNEAHRHRHPIDPARTVCRPPFGDGGGRFSTCRKGAIMADTTTAPASGRVTLRLPAQPSSRPAPASEYARAYMLRLARKLAERNATRRAALRARAVELIAADRIGGTR